MRLLAALAILAFSGRTTADLVPPFESPDQRRIGYWEFSGAAKIFPESIMLVPPIQFHKGSAWTNVEVPGGDWSLALALRVSASDAGGGAALWFVDTYGADGPINGGPSRFKGLGVLVNVGFDGGLEIRVLQSGSRDEDHANLPPPVANLEFADGRLFELKVEFSGTQLVVLIDNVEVHREVLLYNLAKLFIGITAATDRRVARVDLAGVKFDLDTSGYVEELQNHQYVLKDHIPPRYQPKEATRLRKPSFNITIDELQAYEEQGRYVRESSPNRLFDVIEELGNATQYVASYGELSAFVRETIMPFSEKWQRRTMKMVERARHARNVTGAAVNYTRDMINAFKAELGANAIRTTQKIFNLESILADVAEGGIDETGELQRMVNDVSNSKTMRTVVIVSLAELAGLIIFLIFVNIPAIKAKILL